MFGLFSKNRDAKKRKAAKELLSLAYKVFNYRKDVIASSDAVELERLIDELDEFILDGKIETRGYDVCADKLEKLMRKCGGRIYPVTFWSDNVETVIVAGILALALRSFFIQPFKIPTNSMYPSFYGMTPQVYKAGDPTPNIAEKAWRFVTLGASNYSAVSPENGELYIEVNPPDRMGSGVFPFEMVRTDFLFGLWPAQDREYTFYVENAPVKIKTPADFPIEDVIAQYHFNMNEREQFVNMVYAGGSIVQKDGRNLLRLGKVEKGRTVLNFDILTGDMLFVDRFTYNFRKPEVGESFVFLTKYIDGMTVRNRGVPDDKYYIKRIAGKGGDALEIKNYVLYINGKPAEGSPAFDKNAEREGLYCGYRNDGDLAEGKTLHVPEGCYYALGDNSANSLDSRYWGFVPQRAVVGRSLIICYPFTSRWGTAR